jgi:phosphate acetyltransferase
MKPLDAILDRARANRPRIVLPEGEDPRIVAGAARAAADGLARPVLLGDAARIAALLAEAGFEPGSVETLDPAAAPPAQGRRCRGGGAGDGRPDDLRRDDGPRGRR